MLYVGCSYNPLERLEQHIGMSNFFRSGVCIGSLYQEYKDLSVHWTIELYTRDDCLTVLHDLLLQKSYAPERLESDSLERCMIELYHPCLNKRNNPNPSKLPERYQRHKSIEVTARHYVLDSLKVGLTDNLY